MCKCTHIELWDSDSEDSEPFRILYDPEVYDFDDFSKEVDANGIPREVRLLMGSAALALGLQNDEHQDTDRIEFIWETDYSSTNKAKNGKELTIIRNYKRFPHGYEGCDDDPPEHIMAIWLFAVSCG